LFLKRKVLEREREGGREGREGEMEEEREREQERERASERKRRSRGPSEDAPLKLAADMLYWLLTCFTGC
jgi:hypothetical protein